MMAELERLLYRKQYDDVQALLKNIKKDQLAQPHQQIVVSMAGIRLELMLSTMLRKVPIDYHEAQRLITTQCAAYKKADIPTNILTVHEYAMRGFLCELDCTLLEQQKQQLEKQFTKQVIKLPPLLSVFHQLQPHLQKSLYFHISLLELYIKRNSRLKVQEQAAQLTKLQQLVQDLATRYPQTLPLCRRLSTILVHMRIHHNNQFSIDLHEQTVEYLDQCLQAVEGNYNGLINVQTVVVLLYNCLKVIFGFNQLSKPIVGRLDRLLGVKGGSRDYQWYILQVLFRIKSIIFGNKLDREPDASHGKGQVDYSENYSVYLNINLDEIIVSLNDIARSIIRDKVASLCTLVGIKLGIPGFSKDFLEVMHDSPFNNDVQTIKLCFELFQSGEYKKMENLLQAVLSVPATKDLKMREVLVAMCSILVGLKLEHREEGLLYNKLNLQNYNNYKAEILNEETLYQHVGFGYYNLACHEVYLENREVYLVKALENFLESYRINSESYLLNYCMGKIYLQMYDYSNAYKHAMQACKSHRGSWAPFCLLACVYMCDRKLHKATLLVEELLKKYKGVPLLYYIRAYLEANKILLEVEHDEEIESARILGEQFYLTHYERLLRHKSTNALVEYCQVYYQLSMGEPSTPADENFFTREQFLTDAQSRREGTKYVLQIIGLLQSVEQLNSVESLLRKLPDNSIETLYHKALLHQKRGELKQARAEFLSILKLNHTHCPTLIKLALLPESETVEAYRQCNHYLEMAAKFINDAQFMLAKGIVLSRLGLLEKQKEQEKVGRQREYKPASLQRTTRLQSNVQQRSKAQAYLQEGSRALLANREVAWCMLLPDLMYYYY